MNAMDTQSALDEKYACWYLGRKYRTLGPLPDPTWPDWFRAQNVVPFGRSDSYYRKNDSGDWVNVKVRDLRCGDDVLEMNNHGMFTVLAEPRRRGELVKAGADSESNDLVVAARSYLDHIVYLG
jgi:hypothetical protein